MRLNQFGPFDLSSFAAGVLSGTPLLLLAALMVGAAGGDGTIAATLAISGLALGAVAAAVFAVAYINTYLTSRNDKETPR